MTTSKIRARRTCFRSSADTLARSERLRRSWGRTRGRAPVRRNALCRCRPVTAFLPGWTSPSRLFTACASACSTGQPTSLIIQPARVRATPHHRTVGQRATRPAPGRPHLWPYGASAAAPHALSWGTPDIAPRADRDVQAADHSRKRARGPAGQRAVMGRRPLGVGEQVVMRAHLTADVLAPRCRRASTVSWATAVFSGSNRRWRRVWAASGTSADAARRRPAAFIRSQLTRRIGDARGQKPGRFLIPRESYRDVRSRGMARPAPIPSL